MPDMKVLELERPHPQITHIVELLASELSPCPERSKLGDFVEPFDVLNPGNYFVVIASDDMGAVRSRPLEHFNGSRIIPDNIAAANDLLKFAFRVCEYRFKGMPVGVNISEYQELHKRIKVISGGAPMRTGTPIVPRPEFT